MWSYNYFTADELMHYGVPGMKWGHRKMTSLANQAGRIRSRFSGNSAGKKQSGNQTGNEQTGQKNPNQKKGLSDGKKRAIKIGAIAAGTALAAYGTYKASKYVQQKRSDRSLDTARKYIDDNFFRKIEERTYKSGTKEMFFQDGRGNSVSTVGVRKQLGGTVGEHNSKVISTARQMYRDSLDNRVDRGLGRIVNAGDKVGRATKPATDIAKKATKPATDIAKKATNRVLDVVHPAYELKPKNPELTTVLTKSGGYLVRKRR